MDPNGYAELVIHPPPMNFFTILLMPFIIKKSFMKKGSKCFSKFIFWLENIVYIMSFLFYEIFLSPLVYFKIFLSIFFMSGILKFIPFSLLWLVTGPFIVMGFIGKDVYLYIKILCNYQD